MQTFGKGFNSKVRENSKPFKYVSRPKKTTKMNQHDWINYFSDCWYMEEYMRQYFRLIEKKKTYTF